MGGSRVARFVAGIEYADVTIFGSRELGIWVETRKEKAALAALKS